MKPFKAWALVDKKTDKPYNVCGVMGKVCCTKRKAEGENRFFGGGNYKPVRVMVREVKKKQ